MATYSLNVNKKNFTVDVDPDTPLLWVLRDHLDLAGTKYGCGIGQCGSCTVHVEGKPTRSCSIPISALKDAKVVTIEGLSENGDHPLQVAWNEEDVPQCGYCQAGQIMTAAAFLNKNPSPSDKEIRQAMHGNLCRCASYNRIEKAVKSASTKLN